MKEKTRKLCAKTKAIFQCPTRRNVKLKFKAVRMARKLKNLDSKVNKSTIEKAKMANDKKWSGDKTLKELCQEVVTATLKKNLNVGKVKKLENKKLIKHSIPVETNEMTALVKQMQI